MYIWLAGRCRFWRIVCHFVPVRWLWERNQRREVLAATVYAAWETAQERLGDRYPSRYVGGRWVR